MNTEESGISFSELVDAADALFESCEEDEECLARALGSLDPDMRNELLISDLLNAYQAFYYFFREYPGDLEQERLILQPASALTGGVLVSEFDLLMVVFHIDNGEPVISVIEEDRLLADFRGADSYRDAIRFIDENF